MKLPKQHLVSSSPVPKAHSAPPANALFSFENSPTKKGERGNLFLAYFLLRRKIAATTITATAATAAAIRYVLIGVIVVLSMVGEGAVSGSWAAAAGAGSVGLAIGIGALPDIFLASPKQ